MIAEPEMAEWREDLALQRPFDEDSAWGIWAERCARLVAEHDVMVIEHVAGGRLIANEINGFNHQAAWMIAEDFR